MSGATQLFTHLPATFHEQGCAVISIGPLTVVTMPCILHWHLSFTKNTERNRYERNA